MLIGSIDMPLRRLVARLLDVSVDQKLSEHGVKVMFIADVGARCWDSIPRSWASPRSGRALGVVGGAGIPAAVVLGLDFARGHVDRVACRLVLCRALVLHLLVVMEDLDRVLRIRFAPLVYGRRIVRIAFGLAYILLLLGGQNSFPSASRGGDGDGSSPNSLRTSGRRSRRPNTHPL